MMYKVLNGLWDFTVDLDPKYHTHPVYADPGWDRRHWQKVPVPGVWNKYAERLDIYEGVCWFAREFNIDSLPDNPIAILRFGGINYKCRVFLNGIYINEHEGGYTEFTIDVSDEIKLGENCLVIEVDNRSTQIKMPPCLGYFNYGGIHRDVTLEIHQGRCCLKDIFIDAVPGVSGGLIRVTGRIVGCNRCGAIKVSCNGSDLITELGTKRSFDVALEVPNISLWSPGSPNLYDASVQLICNCDVIYETSLMVGFRSIGAEDGKLILNGEPIFLKGVCYLYDSPAYGVTMNPDQYLKDISLFKELGVNAIRSHFPFTTEFYNACDEAGIMVWIETPIYCIYPPDDKENTEFSDPGFRELANTMIEEMVIHARSHPCVIIYGLGNECNMQNPEARPFFQELSENIKQLDSTRLISYASLYCNVGPMADMVDILGFNEYWGWYDRIDQRDTSEKTKPIDLKVLDNKIDEIKLHGKPLLITEFGADSIPGYLSNSCEFWSEDYQAELIRETFSIIKSKDISGAFPFCFTDYRDPSKPVNGYWNGMNYKGLLTYQRQAKMAFNTLREIYK